MWAWTWFSGFLWWVWVCFQMEAYGRLLRGTEAEPAPEKWQQMEAQFQRLQRLEAVMLDAEDFKAQLGLLRSEAMRGVKESLRGPSTS
jgi:hypothetical protein